MECIIWDASRSIAVYICKSTRVDMKRVRGSSYVWRQWDDNFILIYVSCGIIYILTTGLTHQKNGEEIGCFGKEDGEEVRGNDWISRKNGLALKVLTSWHLTLDTDIDMGSVPNEQTWYWFLGCWHVFPFYWWYWWSFYWFYWWLQYKKVC